jgi:hypothetical protein
LSDAEFGKTLPTCQTNSPQVQIANSSIDAVSVLSARPNETLSVLAMCVSNPDRSPVGINR